MLSHLVLGMLVGLIGPDLAEEWKPFDAFIGTWSGTRLTAAGQVTVTRDYEAVGGNELLLVSDRVASDRSTWGLVTAHPDRGGFVLMRFEANGSLAELVLRQASKDATTLVFDGAPGTRPSVERITLERLGGGAFIERVEVSVNGAPFMVVSQTRFHRKR